MSTKELFVNILANLGVYHPQKVKYTLKDGKFHSVNDRPAFETATGIKAWFKEGMLHRSTLDEKGLTLPAFIKKNSNGTESLEEWWIDDKQHREDIDPVTGKDLPSEIFICSQSSYKCWRKNGEIHRPYKNGPAYINRFVQSYVEEGLPHRGDDLPAVVGMDGVEREWWVRGKRHRDTKDSNGKLLPAVIHANGRHEFWIDGVRQI